MLQVSTDGNQWESTWQTVGDSVIISDRPRLTTNVTRSYEGTDEVYVRAYLCGNNSKAAFYDIYIANEGENSKKLITGISNQNTVVAKKTAAIFNLRGIRQQSMKRGLNIVIDEQGQARKVMVK